MSRGLLWKISWIFVLGIVADVTAECFGFAIVSPYYAAPLMNSNHRAVGQAIENVIRNALRHRLVNLHYPSALRATKDALCAGGTRSRHPGCLKRC